MELRPLGVTGLRVSPIGFGASPLGNEFGEISEAETIRAVHEAIELGVNFFDVSPYYGRTSRNPAWDRHCRVSARKLFSPRSAAATNQSLRLFSPPCSVSIDESLQRLRTDYVDLFQVHDIEFGDLKQIEEETLPALR